MHRSGDVGKCGKRMNGTWKIAKKILKVSLLKALNLLLILNKYGYYVSSRNYSMNISGNSSPLNP